MSKKSKLKKKRKKYHRFRNRWRNILKYSVGDLVKSDEDPSYGTWLEIKEIEKSFFEPIAGHVLAFAIHYRKYFSNFDVIGVHRFHIPVSKWHDPNVWPLNNSEIIRKQYRSEVIEITSFKDL